MNFYIGNSVEDIVVTDRNAAFSDELQNYMYKLRKRVDCDMDILFNIDSYSDVVIPREDVSELVRICDYILSESVLADYFEKAEGIEEVCELKQIAEEALEKGTGLVSLGD